MLVYMISQECVTVDIKQHREAFHTKLFGLFLTSVMTIYLLIKLLVLLIKIENYF